MNRAIPFLALLLIALGLIGLVAVYLVPSQLTFGAQGVVPGGMTFAPHSFGSAGVDGGMMGGGMTLAPHSFGSAGVGGRGRGSTPNVGATPVPANQPVDREVDIAVRNFQFNPVRVTVKQGETVRFTFTNRDSFVHNFGSTQAGIPFILLPANGVASTAWVAAQKGTYNALCTLHPGMQLLITVE